MNGERMNKVRIRGDMSFIDAIATMCGGNPGSMAACVEIMNLGSKIDPGAAMGALMHILMLDTLNVYDGKIYLLWNDVCERDVGKVIAVIRANQLGELCGVTTEKIHHAINHRGNGLDTDAIVKAVKKRTARF